MTLSSVLMNFSDNQWNQLLLESWQDVIIVELTVMRDDRLPTANNASHPSPSVSPVHLSMNRVPAPLILQGSRAPVSNAPDVDASKPVQSRSVY